MTSKASISFKGLEELKRGLNDLQQTQYPFAMSKSLNVIADKAKSAVIDRMDVDFDRPTPFTKNSMRVVYANKKKLESGVRFKEPTRLSYDQHYLYPPTYGVNRGFKKFEGALLAKGLIPIGYYAVPTRLAPFDAFGNIPGSEYTRILSYFEAFNELGYKQNMKADKKEKLKKGTKKNYGFSYFIIKQQKQENKGLHPGIYKKTYLYQYVGRGGKLVWKTAIKPILLYVKAIGYRKQYMFHETAVDVFNSNINEVFGHELQNALNTAFNK